MNSGFTKLVLVLLIGVSLTACGPRKRTTVTTVTTTTEMPAVVPVQTASGVAGVSDSAAAKARPATQGAGTTANAAAVDDGAGTFRTRGKMVMAGVGSALVYEGATGAGFGAASAGTGPLVAGASGAQCANPFGGDAAAGGQSICADTGEKLACQCTDGSCQLFRTAVMACGPAGAVVN